MRLSARIAWKLASVPNAISQVFTWEWPVWWTAALLRFALTGEDYTVERLDGVDGGALGSPETDHTGKPK
jgi:hypothetical protein